MKNVIISVTPDLEDFLEEWLWIEGASSVTTLPPHERERSINALFQELDEDAFQKKLAAELNALGRGPCPVRFEQVPDEDWQVKWRESFQPLQIGGFRVVGEWESESADDKTIRVYPGQAFGTGQHETTRMIIRALETLDLTDKKIMDAGCGTGILAIAAERLGAKSVFGFDLDPDCAENMARHLRINQSEKIELQIGRLEDFDHTGFDVVLANININVLLELWPEVAKRLVPGGVLLSSGILIEQEDVAVAGLERSGFRIQTRERDGDWLFLRAQRS